jgi:hypothetical protein
MKTSSILAVAACAALTILAGCSGNTPGDTALAMRADMCKTKDMGSMTKYLTEESKPMMEMVTKLASSPEKKAMMDKNLTETCAKPAKVVSEKITGDTAEVTLEGDKPMKMRKVDGKWLVVISKN